MRIKRLSLRDILPAVARSVVTNRNKGTDKKLGYVLRHGTFSGGKDKTNGGFAITTYLGDRKFKPQIEGEELRLDGDNWVLTPMLKKQEDGTYTPMLDKQGNVIYIINKEEYLGFNTDTVVFWDIPFGTYTDVHYELEGSVRELACGYTSKWYLDTNILIPAPMLEVFGSCTLKWSAVDIKKKQLITQTITYDLGNDEWNIPPHTTTEIKE